MTSIQRLLTASSILTIAFLGMSIGVGQPPGPSGVGGTQTVLAPCNGKTIVPYAIGERCEGSTGNCPSFNPNLTGGGCGQVTTIAGTIMSPMAGDQFCDNGFVPGENCVDDQNQPRPCLYAYVCAATAIPNPSHNPDDPSSPLIITICDLGPRGDVYRDRFKPSSPECTSL